MDPIPVLKAFPDVGGYTETQKGAANWLIAFFHKDSNQLIIVCHVITKKTFVQLFSATNGYLLTRKSPIICLQRTRAAI